MRHKHRVKSRKLKVKSLGVATLLTLIISLSSVHAQTMYVKQSNGTQTAYTLSNLQKMSFSTGNLTVTKQDNSSGVYALSDLRYLSFLDISTNLDKPLLDQIQILSAYPNPASNVLNLDLKGTAQGVGTLCILNFEGKTVLTRQISNVGTLTIDISHLPSGIYLCRYKNASEVKTVKIIKQ